MDTLYQNKITKVYPEVLPEEFLCVTFIRIIEIKGLGILYCSNSFE
jgi:hypothetical protein